VYGAFFFQTLLARTPRQRRGFFYAPPSFSPSLSARREEPGFFGFLFLHFRVQGRSPTPFPFSDGAERSPFSPSFLPPQRPAGPLPSPTPTGTRAPSEAVKYDTGPPFDRFREVLGTRSLPLSPFSSIPPRRNLSFDMDEGGLFPFPDFPAHSKGSFSDSAELLLPTSLESSL